MMAIGVLLAGVGFPRAQTPPPAPATQASAQPGTPFQPQPILQGGQVLTLFPQDSPFLKKDKLAEAEQVTMTNGVPGRVQSIVNIHNPSIELHPVDRGTNTGAVVILAAGGAHNTLNVGTEGADFVPFFYNYGVNTVILRNRLKTSGYDPLTDEIYDTMQAIRMVRAHAKDWNLDPNKIGVVGFSAGAELAAPAGLVYDDFDRKNNQPGDSLAGVSSRPDFIGLIYPGPTPFARDVNTVVPKNAPPAFITCAGTDDAQHALWADQFFAGMLKARIPNLEMHIYGNGVHAGGLKDRNDTPFGTWQFRFIDWFRDLGFLGKPGVETKAARDVANHLNPPPARGRGTGSGG